MQNLVELVAYCLETDEQALVYRYLPNGSFRDWLSRSSKRARAFAAEFAWTVKQAKPSSHNVDMVLKIILHLPAVLI